MSAAPQKAPARAVPVLGLTGPSGGGKGAVGAILREQGACVIDTDVIAREATADAGVLAELREAFGAWVLTPEGAFNRAEASHRAFRDKGFLARLTNITHKYIIREIDSRVARIRAEAAMSAATEAAMSAAAEVDATTDAAKAATPNGSAAPQAIVLDAPVPIERGFLDVSQEVWAVLAPEPARLRRVMERDGVSEEDAKARFASQLPEEGYARLATVVVRNDGDSAALQAQVLPLWHAFIGKYGVAGRETGY